MMTQVGLAVRLENWEDDGGTVESSARGDERLDWAAFLARFYPDARRHDYAPLVAYTEYRKNLTPAHPVSGINPPGERSRP